MTPTPAGPDPAREAESRAAADPLAAVQPPPPPGRLRELLRAAALDIGPLRRHRDFRLLFVGQGVSFVGSMVTYVAIPFQVFALTHSSLAVGLISLTELVPLIGFGLLGGAIADASDRRRTVLLAEVGLAVCSAVLVGNALLDRPRVAVLYLLAAVLATLDGLQRPSLDALVPRIVTREEVPAAAALSSLRANVGLIAGPPLGGLLIAGFGLPATYAVDVASFAASLTALTLMRAVPPAPDAAPPNLRGIVEGLRYARSRPELLGTYLVDMNAMFFGMPTALFPALAASYGGPRTLGLLYAAPSVGSLLATLTSGWASRVSRHGLAIVLGATGWGLAIAAFGLVRGLLPALALLALAGAADMVSGLFRTTIWNQTVPDELRGRLAGIELLSYSSGPLLGNVEAGSVATLTSLRTSVVSGGVLCVAGTGLLALALPGFLRYDARRQTSHETTAAATTPAAT